MKCQVYILQRRSICNYHICAKYDFNHHIYSINCHIYHVIRVHNIISNVIILCLWEITFGKKRKPKLQKVFKLVND